MYACHASILCFLGAFKTIQAPAGASSYVHKGNEKSESGNSKVGSLQRFFKESLSCLNLFISYQVGHMTTLLCAFASCFPIKLPLSEQLILQSSAQMPPSPGSLPEVVVTVPSSKHASHITLFPLPLDCQSPKGRKYVLFFTITAVSPGHIGSPQWKFVE